MSLAYTPSRTPLAKLARLVRQSCPAQLVNLRFPEAIVSFTFDDVPRSAATIGADILHAEEARGVFYLSAGFTDQQTHFGAMHTNADVKHLQGQGHEIGCHTYSHRDGANTPSGETLRDIDRNSTALKHLGAATPSSFAYPYGETSIALKMALKQRFSSARGIRSGLNWGPTDVMNLRAQRLYGEDSWAGVSRVLHQAKSQSGWAIVFTHDVQSTPTAFGCTPERLQRAVRLARSLGLLILPVRDALARAEH